MTYRTMFTVASGLTALMSATELPAGPIDASRHSHPEKVQLVHEAEHSVDHAWEIYHGAALGGTVASPGLQAQIERHLHEARTLVTDAQEAADRGDAEAVERLVGRIKSHAAQAIAGSKEQKQ
jgi:hypothetical protein